MSTVKVNTVDKRTGSTLTLGGCGTTVTLGAGATQSGFGRTGTVDWCTTAKTSPFTGVSGKGYFVNTTCGAVTVTLPASPSAGDIISIADYTNTWQTNIVTICRNSSKIGGVCANATLSTQGQSITLVYVDATEGWKNVQDSTSNVIGASYLTATGGTVTTCGNYKIHTFTSDSTFTVSALSNIPTYNNIDYLVVAGGGGGGKSRAGAGGAGGYRESYNPCTSGTYTASPLATPTSFPVTATSYPVTIGAGGAGAPGCTCGCSGSSGVNSVFSTITSAGGGGGGSNAPHPGAGVSGGSGGGGVDPSPGPQPGGAGNTPPTSPPQGNPGGTGVFSGPYYGAGGGGGATSSGGNGTSTVGGAGGNGAGTQINNIAPVGAPGPSPTSRYFAGGGGGGGNTGTSGAPGYGGGGIGGEATTIVGNGVTNTGGGAGGGTGAPNPCYNPTTAGGNGGSGIVIIRYKYQ